MGVDVEAIKKKYAEMNEKSDEYDDDIPWIKLEVGDNNMRLLCGANGNFYVETGYHYIPKAGSTKKNAVTCLKIAKGERCYLCEVVASLRKSGKKDDKALAKELSASPRIFMNVIDRDDNDTVKVLGCGNMIFKGILKYIADDDWGDITDAKQGRNIVIERIGTGKNDTEYSVRPKPKINVVDMSKIELFDLEEMVTIPTIAEQKAILAGEEPPEREAKDEKTPEKEPVPEKEPEPEKKATPPRRAAKSEPEEKEEDTPPFDEGEAASGVSEGGDIDDEIAAALEQFK